ncbi:MAG: hypothetical protein ACRELD_12105 [Longimicrobiales bacterium]
MSGTQKNRGRGAHALPIALVLAVALAGCEFLDPTEVENPRTTVEDLADAEQPTAALLPGVRAQFARALNGVVSTTENVSDNYSVHGTGILKEHDEPRAVTPVVMNSTGDASGSAYWNLQELRAFSEFVLDDIVPNDTTAQAEHVAEIQFYRALAYLMLAENFVAVPLEPDGAPVPADQLLETAIAGLNASLQTAPAGELATAVRAALARAYRVDGDAAQAGNNASAALVDDGPFVFAQDYDATSIDNTPHDFLVQRALQEMQPLPRLDFLDPKFTSEEAAIPFAKAEEMHLILAEIALEAGDLGGARNQIAAAVELAQGRPTETFSDNDLRKNGDLTIRPRHAEFLVAACPTCPFRADLVRTRPGPVPVPVITGTSLNADSVRALASEMEVRHALHLARQEMLLLEGRRMSDLGIRLPMMLREIDANLNIADGDLGTEPLVPAYIPPRDDMDLFDPQSPYTDPSTGDNPVSPARVTMLVDMNQVLAEQRVSPFRN